MNILQSWHFTLDLITSKSMEVTYSLWLTSVPSFMSVKQNLIGKSVGQPTCVLQYGSFLPYLISIWFNHTSTRVRFTKSGLKSEHSSKWNTIYIKMKKYMKGDRMEIWGGWAKCETESTYLWQNMKICTYMHCHSQLFLWKGEWEWCTSTNTVSHILNGPENLILST